MLAVFFCLAGIFTILAASERLDQRKILSGDQKRKFIQISSGIFIASWPWLTSWRAIAWIGVAMLAVVLMNHRRRIVDFHTQINRQTYGDICFALAVIACAILTDQKVFFALAILTMSVGDGLANLIGQEYGQKWRYSVFGNPKTVLGSMTLWVVSLYILGLGLLFAYQAITFNDYAVLLLVLPPLLVAVENLAFKGLDDLVIPLVVIAALNLAK